MQQVHIAKVETHTKIVTTDQETTRYFSVIKKTNIPSEARILVMAQ